MQFTEVFGINNKSISIRRNQMLRTYTYLGHLQVLFTCKILYKYQHSIKLDWKYHEFVSVCIVTSAPTARLIPRPPPFFLFFGFRSVLPLPCIILNTNWRTKNRGGLGTRLPTATNKWYFSGKELGTMVITILSYKTLISLHVQT